MKIKGYAFKIDMNPEWETYIVELPGAAEGKFFYDKAPKYSDEQKIEFENEKKFILEQIPRFLEEMRSCTSIKVVGEDMCEDGTLEDIEMALRSQMLSLKNLIGLDTQKGHLCLDSDYYVVWGDEAHLYC